MPSHHALYPSRCADGLNSWAGSAGNCETFYEWEVVTSPGLQPVAFSASPIHACDDSKCSGTGTSRGCNGILADINSLPGRCRAHMGAEPRCFKEVALRIPPVPCLVLRLVWCCAEHLRCAATASPLAADGRYQVFVVAYNQFGFTRSAASNVVTVGTPTSQPLDVTATDGTAQIGISFPTPSVSDSKTEAACGLL